MSLKAHFFLLLSGSLALTSIGTIQTKAQSSIVGQSAISIADVAQILISQTEQKYRQGEISFRDGKMNEAQESFNTAIDKLLTAPPEIRNHYAVQSYYFELVNKINLLQIGASNIRIKSMEASNAPLTVTRSPLDELSKVDINKEKVSSVTKLDPIHFDFKFAMTPEVYKFINFYTSGRGRTTMEHGLARSGRYRAMAERIFSEEGVPRDLIWLAQVESVWQYSALSWAAAKGIWQFIPATGQRFGLTQNSWVDERVAPEKATRAAAKYLKFLNNYFAGDWLLAMAAYNTGEMNVEKAISRCGYADFWEIYQRNLIPNETRNYVPAILAVIAVAKDPKKYGFNVTPEPAWKCDVVKINDQLDLNVAANLLEVSADHLKSLNPEVKKGITPPSSFDLKVPFGMRKKFEVAYASLPADQRLTRPLSSFSPALVEASYKSKNANKNEETSSTGSTGKFQMVLVKHKVRRGDTLTSIASHYGTSVLDLAQHNHLSSRSELKRGEVIQVPVEQNQQGYNLQNTRLKYKHR